MVLPVSCVVSVGLPRLQSLDLGYNDISELPDGPYLDALQSLSLASNALSRVPGALARATALSSLELTGNEPLELHYEDLELFAALKRPQSLVSDSTGWLGGGGSMCAHALLPREWTMW